MTSWTTTMMAALTATTLGAGSLIGAAPAWAQDASGVPGDRLVVPVPDVSGLSDEDAQGLLTDLARMNVVTSECPDWDVTDPEWQLMNDTTDALMRRLQIDAVAYDREYFRPAFNVLDDPQACDSLGPEVAGVIARLEEMGGGTQPVTPGLEAPAEQDGADQDSADQDSADQAPAEQPEGQAAEPAAEGDEG